MPHKTSVFGDTVLRLSRTFLLLLKGRLLLCFRNSFLKSMFLLLTRC